MFGHQGFSESRTGVSNGLAFRMALNAKQKTSIAAKLFTRILRTLIIDTDSKHNAKI
jgi:hypothetical protein